MALFSFSVTSILLSLLLTYLSYAICLGFYRLYLDPLSKFPGPKAAALSYWYEFYWEVVRPGRFTWHIKDLHKKYGPIVRITPREVHILDSSFYDELYARPKGVRHKLPRFSARFGWRSDCFSTWQHDIHRMRRTAINPFFSAKRITALQPLLREKLTKFARRLIEAHENESLVQMDLGYMALTGDITTEYAFAQSYNQLDSPGFSENYDDCLKALYVVGNLSLHITWIHKILDATPRAITAVVNPIVLPVLDFLADCQNQIHDIRMEINQGHKLKENPTIFHELLNTSVLPKWEKTDERLGDEAVEIIGAGIITTSSTLTLGTYHILKNPPIHAKLSKELTEYFDSGLNLSNLELNKNLFEWHALEPLPYLYGCIRESIRLSGGVVTRDPRIAPEEDIRYGSYSIPRGTAVSMTTWHIANDPKIFPDPEAFRPERWLITKRDGTFTRNVEMDRWVVAFGKGSRQCAGINLAFAELHLTMAMVFRSFSMELHETDESDVKVNHAYLVPYPKFDSKGVRVRITGLNV